VFSVAFAVFHGSFFERAVRALKQGRVDSMVESEDLLGERAEVTLPLSGGELGQIAVEAKGSVRHLTARLDVDGRADIGAAVWIAEVTGEGVAVVSCTPIDGTRTDLPHPTTTGRSARPAA